MVPSIAVMPREGSFALAFFGRTRNVQEPTLSVAAGRKSFVLKRIEVLVICLMSLITLRFLDAGRLAPAFRYMQRVTINFCVA